MKCIKCGKEVVKPLELFNGDLRCPLCGASVVPGEGQVAVTRENDELYRLSKANFLTYLEKASTFDVNTSKKEKSEAEGFRDRAVEFCGQAAYALHPEAIVDLGYYYSKDYINEDIVGVGRYKTAYSYFRCITDPKNFDDIRERYKQYFIETGSSASAADEAARVVTKAAYYMLDMISTAPEEFASQGEYTLEKAKELIESNPNIRLADMGTFADKTPAEDAEDKLKRIEDTLDRCRERSSSHSPLFGYFEITSKEYVAVKQIAAKYPKGIVMELLYEQGDLEWGGIGNTEVEHIIASDDGLKMYFCFFNQNSASKVYKKGFKASSLEGVLFDRLSADNNLAQLIRAAGKKGQTFYWDDGYFVTRNRAKLRREAGGRDYAVTDGFIMLSSGEYEDALEK
ncbi:MAG: hypothetical protein LUD51_03870 [Clostridia bacterium]|nr:hypothetical protein [Clostridia bacterium]